MRTFLCLNYGSSSLKYALFEGQRQILKHKRVFRGEDLSQALRELAKELPISPEVVLHRVVHGMEHKSPMPIEGQSLAILRELARINPLHNSIALEGIEQSLELFSKSKHYAIFDTDFHSSIPESARIYGLDYELYQRGIKRYGFHGISYSYLLRRSKQVLEKTKPNLIMMHLGQGCSVCAVKEGVSVYTSMGFTPLEGLLMVARPGDVDAGVILHMLRSGLSVEELEGRLYRESGIRAIAGVSDFEELLTLKRNGNRRAILAFEAFLHRLLKYVGAYWFLLEGKVDALVFSGGIGENSPEVREELCKRLAFLGVELDQEANRKNQEFISSKGSSVKVLVIETQEELEMINIFVESNKII